MWQFNNVVAVACTVGVAADDVMVAADNPNVHPDAFAPEQRGRVNIVAYTTAKAPAERVMVAQVAGSLTVTLS
ncbi:MAG: hypothetical protein WBE90_01350 [Xanthobacteraceae bacterium]